MAKFRKNYRLLVQGRDNSFVEIKPPISIEFNVNRNYLGSVNESSINVYNLSERVRRQIGKDLLEIGLNRRAELFVGYGDNLSRIGYGYLRTVYSRRDVTDFITTIEFFDGGWEISQSRSRLSFPKGTKKQTVVNFLVNELLNQGLKLGAIGKIEGELSRGNSLSGNTMSILNDITGNKAYIDNGAIYVLSDNEAVLPAITINSESGLLSSPIRQNTYINFRMLLEPDLQIGQIINLQSTRGEGVNGLHKIYTITHYGNVSESVDRETITIVGLWNREYNGLLRGSRVI